MERILKIMEYNANYKVLMFWRILFVVFAVSASLTARGQYADVLKYGSIGELEDFIELCDREIQSCEKELNSDLAKENSMYREQIQEGLDGWKRWKRDAEKRIMEKQMEEWNERNRRNSELNKRSQEQWASRTVKTTRSGGITIAPTSRTTTRTSTRGGTIIDRNSASRRKSVQRQSNAAKRSWERRAEALAEAERRQKERALEKELRKQEQYVETYNKANAALAPMAAAAKQQIVEQSVVGMDMKRDNADYYWKRTGYRVSKGNVDLDGGRNTTERLTGEDRARMRSLLDENSVPMTAYPDTLFHRQQLLMLEKMQKSEIDSFRLSTFHYEEIAEAERVVIQKSWKEFRSEIPESRQKMIIGHIMDYCEGGNPIFVGFDIEKDVYVFQKFDSDVTGKVFHVSKNGRALTIGEFMLNDEEGGLSWTAKIGNYSFSKGSVSTSARFTDGKDMADKEMNAGVNVKFTALKKTVDMRWHKCFFFGNNGLCYELNSELGPDVSMGLNFEKMPKINTSASIGSAGAGMVVSHLKGDDVVLFGGEANVNIGLKVDTNALKPKYGTVGGKIQLPTKIADCDKYLEGLDKQINGF